MSDDIHVTVDDGSAERELNRLLAIPENGSGDLGRGLLMVQEEIRAHIHVFTGKLKADVHNSHKTFGPIWEGKVVIGEGLGYAVYEKDREGVKTVSKRHPGDVGHGTPHNFIAASEEEAYETMLAAIMEAMS